MFADDTKSFKMVKAKANCDELWGEGALHKLKEWRTMCQMKFSESTCMVMGMGTENANFVYANAV